MSAELSHSWRLAQLNREIEQLEADLPRREADRNALAEETRRAAWKLCYLRLARWLRLPKVSFELWPVGVLTVGPILTGVLLFILTHYATGSNIVSLVAFLLGTAAGAGVFVSLLYRPADALLPAEVAAAESQRNIAQARLEELLQSQAAAQSRLAALLEERRELMASGKVQRAALLQREWKTMPAAEWEDFVVEVLRTLGATVERTPRTIEEGTTLIAHFDNRRVAIVTHGEGHVASSSAVHQAVAKMQRHACDACAVILNRRFTGAAQDFASRNQCTLIGVEEFPDFVLGTIELSKTVEIKKLNR